MITNGAPAAHEIMSAQNAAREAGESEGLSVEGESEGSVAWGAKGEGGA